MLDFSCVEQAYRVFNTWMGDPVKVILLEELIKVVKEEKLLENATVTGKKMVDGLTELQVCCFYYFHSVV